VAPKNGANGTEISFGQGNDDISEGITDAITFNGNKGANNVSFNVLTYAYGPTESDPNASTEIVLTKTDNVYQGELVQGHQYEFAGESIMNSSRWFYDRDWFQKNDDGTYTFLGITGTYNIKADFSNLAFRIWVMDGTSSGKLNADGTGAIWIIGNNGVGKPSYKASNVQSWWTGEEYDYCLTPISEKVHQITLTVGQQLNGADINFKKITVAEAEKLIADDFARQKKQAETDEEYYRKFQQYLSPDRAAQMVIQQRSTAAGFSSMFRGMGGGRGGFGGMGGMMMMF
jgi:hypothetical protein